MVIFIGTNVAPTIVSLCCYNCCIESEISVQTLTIGNRFSRMLLAFIVVTFFTILPAQATPIIGTAVANTTSTTPVGSAAGDGTIAFYIDLSGSSTYGVDGGGTSADTCEFPDTCTGGTLTMHLFFAGVQPGLTTVMLNFTDLDVDGVNDPGFFIEELLIYSGGVLIAIINAASDLDLANYDTQMIEFDLDVNGDFYITLVFSTAFDSKTKERWYQNTAEYMLATATSVPEPGTLALFGFGLLLLAFSRRRESITTSVRNK